MIAHWLYFAYDTAGELLYIGCTSNISHRLRQHERSSPWASQVARIETAGSWPREVAFNLERSLIREHQPRYNYVHWAHKPNPINPKTGRPPVGNRLAVPLDDLVAS